MLKQRVVGVITVKDGWAVQSFGYHRYLPLGKPEVLAENLDRWGADEIILQCIDRSVRHAGPDFTTLAKVARKGLGTPIIYSGGVRSVEDGTRVVQSGADRIALDALLHETGNNVLELSHRLGAQALIGSLPVSLPHDNLRWYDYRTRSSKVLSDTVLRLIQEKTISEVLLVDWQHEGQLDGFEPELVRRFPLADIPLIAFGGLSSPAKVREVLTMPRVVAAAVGNFFNYREHAVAAYKQQLGGLPIRMPTNQGTSK